MKKYLYHIECITNLHVGSDNTNYNIIDKEVEKDPITGFPIIHASGIKGALRDAYEKNTTNDDKMTTFLFGAPSTRDGSDNSGTLIFMNAKFISRPLRLKNGNAPYINTTSLRALEDYVALTSAFGLNNKDLNVPNSFNFDDNEFLVSPSNDNAMVEGEKTGKLIDELYEGLEPLLGENFAIAKSFDNYDLPVIARNNLQTPQGNLWHEEYVPYNSKFCFIVMAPEEIAIDTVIPEVAQIGGNASVGYGYCRFKKIRSC